ncbi:hypothetical protein HDU84_009686, partial [Entophlyctis sp. JEL0112]
MPPQSLAGDAHAFLHDRAALRLAVAGAASGLCPLPIPTDHDVNPPSHQHNSYPVSAVLVTPLDVVKIRLQNQFFAPGVVPRYSGTFPTLATIAREEGMRGLFSGLAPSVYAYLPDRVIWFSVYHNAKHALAAEL